MEYPGRGRLVSHPADCSLQTFRGHSVLSTLIRAYWSPAATTGQRYIYSGSADGGIWVYGGWPWAGGGDGIRVGWVGMGVWMGVSGVWGSAPK